MKLKTSQSLNRDVKWLENPGTYHLLVTDTSERPTKSDGTLINGFSYSVTVLEGTVKAEIGKEFEMVFRDPNLRWSQDAQDRDLKAQCRALAAVGLLDESQAGGKEVEINVSEAVGRQFVATFQFKREKNDKTGEYETTKFVQLKGADIWHVDDDFVSDYPKCQSALAKIPPELRRGEAHHTEAVDTGSAVNPNAVDLDDI